MVHHQVLLATPDTIKSFFVMHKAMEHGVELKRFHTDNGMFKSKAFVEALKDNCHMIIKLGIGAHHQNGVAEWAIGTVQAMARAMLLHVQLHWPDGFDPLLWPFALDYAVQIHNNLPTKVKNGLCPNEVFMGIILGCGPLKQLCVFGCPCYVLNPRIQDRKKFPKWESCAYAGQFMGFSKDHSSKVGLVQNLRTGQIMPQFHVVFDKMFHTVTTEMEINLEETWIDLF